MAPMMGAIIISITDGILMPLRKLCEAVALITVFLCSEKKKEKKDGIEADNFLEFFP
jgi:hypothetical protein